jgi:WS/DGAT/MGAT family acyltransferase
MRKLSALDLAFFLFESEGSPKHVAGLLKCKKPPKCPANFVRDLVEKMKTFDDVNEPFNLVINFVGWKGPHWEYCEKISMEDHVFYHRPDKPISWLELEQIVASLHEPIMDRSKPLWEFHLIDNIKGGYFAVYAKLHHAYADGITMTSWFGESLSESPEDTELVPFWTRKTKTRKRMEEKSSFLGKTIRGAKDLAWDQMLATAGIAKLSAQLSLEGVGITKKAVSLPFSASKETPLTGSASPGRRLATTFLTMDRVKRVCKATRSTLNHVALACIDGALHRYLADSGVFLDHPITIQMPVNLRKEGDTKTGNKLGIVLVELAKPTNDPYIRLREIGYTLRNVRNQIDSVPGSSIEQYTILAAAAGELIEKLKLSDTLPAHGHTLVSNVPGPKNRLYINGARVEEKYPISTLAPGLHMNITLFSYAGQLHFGIVSTRDMKKLENLARYIDEEFNIIENAVFNPA